jgi:hypothetical protein
VDLVGVGQLEDAEAHEAYMVEVGGGLSHR